MTRPFTCPSLPRALAAVVLLSGLATSASLHAQSTDAAATPNPAIFHDAAGSVVYAGNFRHYAGDDGGMTHGYLALSLSPSGTVTGSLTWHGSTVAVPLKGRLDVASGQGHFTQRDADGKKLADAVRIPFLVNPSGLTLNGGGTEGNGDSTSFFLTKYSDSSYSYGEASGGTLSVSAGSLTLAGSNSFIGSTFVNAGTLSTPSLSSSITNAGTLNTGSIPSGAINTTISGTSIPALTGTLTLLPTYAGSLLIVTGTGTSPVIDADGNLTYNGGVILHGPITTATNASGVTVYTGTNAAGGSATVTVFGSPVSTTTTTGG